VRDGRAAGWGLALLVVAPLVVAPLVVVGACRDRPAGGPAEAPAPRVTTAQPAAAASAQLYRLELIAPPVVAVGGEAIAAVSVTPVAPYKINLEYPVRLVVRAPAPIAPAERTMGKGEATTFTVKQLLLRPSFRLPAAGVYALRGELRFSVCTESQCELATAPVSWRVSAR